MVAVAAEVEALAPMELKPLVSSAERPLRILVAEDNRVNQRLACVILEKKGWTVEIARDGLEAISKLRQSRFDLVLMDVHMPELDGISATIRIRAGGDNTPILALTASAMGGDAERCLEAGMNGYVAKPFRAEDLCQAVEQAIGRCSLESPARAVVL